jgi:mannan endo-1,4-beta-mannosidase
VKRNSTPTVGPAIVLTLVFAIAMGCAVSDEPAVAPAANGGSSTESTGGSSTGAGGGASSGGAAQGDPAGAAGIRGSNGGSGSGGASGSSEPSDAARSSTDAGRPADVTPPVASTVYHTMGRFLFDPCGTKVVVRGVEQMFWATTFISPSFVDEIAKTGANTIRILPQISPPTPDGKPVMTLGATEALIKSAIADKMLVDIAVDGGSNLSAYVRDDVKTLLLKYERYLVIHAKGESVENSDNEWVTNAKAVVSKMRDAGYKAPLYLLPTNYGRNLPLILDRGQEILDADPLKNIIFGWQAYWGSSNYYQKRFGMTLAQAMQKVAAASFVIQVGLLRQTDPGENLDYSPVMADAQTNEVGWLWWDWRMSSSNLTTDGTFGHWASEGQQVVITNPNGIQKTSIRSPFLVDGACK